MTTTAVSICNSALIKIGEQRISALSDNNPRAILCNEQFTKLRDEVLIAHPWNFAVTRVALSAVADYDDPLGEWAYQFTIPSDCLRILRGDDDERIYVTENGYVLTDESTFGIKYIKQETDYSKYTPLFLEALATRIAIDASYAIVQSNELGDRLKQSYKALLSEARGIDGQEGTPQGFIINTWTDSRR